MGMDYVGRDSSYHLNWSGHSFMLSILEQAGADLDHWSGSNDGVYIPAATCRSWAKTLRAACEGLQVVQVPDTSYGDGYKDFPLLRGMSLEKEATSGSIAGYVQMVAGATSTRWLSGMATEQTQEKEITIEGELRWDPLSFTICIPQSELHKRLKAGESIEDIVDDLVWDSDYSETESDPYYKERVISRVRG